jgi:hypothetical protein
MSTSALRTINFQFSIVLSTSALRTINFQFAPNLGAVPVDRLRQVAGHSRSELAALVKTDDLVCWYRQRTVETMRWEPVRLWSETTLVAVMLQLTCGKKRRCQAMPRSKVYLEV